MNPHYLALFSAITVSATGQLLLKAGAIGEGGFVDPELTVAANLAFHARLHGMRRRDYRSRMAEELARVGLADRLNHPWSNCQPVCQYDW